MTVPLGPGEPVTYAPVKVDESTLNVRRWIEGFQFATICRDTASLQILSSIPVAKLRASSTKSLEYRHLLVEAIQIWRKNQPDTVQLFMDTMTATDPHRPDIVDADYTLHIDVPMIDCLLYAAAEQPEFGGKLARGLALHKKYWTMTEDTRDDWDGMVSLPLLTAAVIAADRGLKFDIDSGYLPMRFVKRGW